MKSTSLGELEQQVMDILWECKKCSVRDVLFRLPKNKKYAYTTVATILQRLYDKEIVKRTQNKSGHIYFPRVSKELYTKNVIQSFLKRFISSFGDTAVASFAESIDKLPRGKREYFLKLLDERETNK